MHGAVRILLSLVVLVAAGFLAYDMANYYLYSPWTRGARVRAEVVTVAPDVSGYVTDVLVGNDQLVHKGDLLFVIDQERYRLALADAEASKARYDELVQDYHKAVISAFSNVEDALAATQRNAEQQAAEEATVAQARRSYEIAQRRYRVGLTDLLTVLNTENALFPAEDTLVQVRLAHMQALVSLFNALGGGWKAGAG